MVKDNKGNYLINLSVYILILIVLYLFAKLLYIFFPNVEGFKYFADILTPDFLTAIFTGMYLLFTGLMILELQKQNAEIKRQYEMNNNPNLEIEKIKATAVKEKNTIIYDFFLTNSGKAPTSVKDMQFFSKKFIPNIAWLELFESYAFGGDNPTVIAFPFILMPYQSLKLSVELEFVNSPDDYKRAIKPPIDFEVKVKHTKGVYVYKPVNNESTKTDLKEDEI